MVMILIIMKLREDTDLMHEFSNLIFGKFDDYSYFC